MVRIGRTIHYSFVEAYPVLVVYDDYDEYDEYDDKDSVTVTEVTYQRYLAAREEFETAERLLTDEIGEEM